MATKKAAGKAAGQKNLSDAVRHPGAFTAKAKARGLDTQEFAGKVAAHPEHYDTTTVRQANLARTFNKIAKSNAKSSRKK